MILTKINRAGELLMVEDNFIDGQLMVTKSVDGYERSTYPVPNMDKATNLMFHLLK